MSKKTDWSGIQRESADRLHAQELADAKKQNKAYADALELAQKERDVALSLSKQKLTTHKIAAINDGESEATAFAIASDWHVEETVIGKTVNGLNEFNLDIAEARIDRFFRSIIRLTDIERAGTRVDHLVLALLGDMMTGYIHEELQEMNGLSPTETVLWLRKRIVAGIKLLQKEGGFKSITIPCTVGNHGRTTKKMRHATSCSNSYEWMMYQIMVDDVPGVNWQIADGYFVYLEVYGRLFRFHHGDNIQYQGGIGGLTIPCEKALASWNKSRPVYCDIFGHHHTAMQNPRWISNGSLIGYGPYSLAIKAGFESPQQTYFLVDPKRGRTGTFPIFLE
jgi:predicted DNA binding CopG/RHH family protein